MGCVERWQPVVALVAVELCLALINIFFKKALNAGVDHAILVVYRQSIATVFLAPFVCFWERTSWTKLTGGVVFRIFLCALLGLTLSQYLFLVGLDYTSATFMCAFVNMVPVITFILAVLLGMEKLNMKRNSGKAKVFGTLICIVGAVMLSLYKGMPLISKQLAALNHRKPARFGLGSAMLSAGSVAWSSWFLIQSRIGEKFPYKYTSTLMMSFFCAAQSTALCFITNRSTSKWILKGELQILSVVYAGVVGSGLCYAVMSWCVKQRGPVFTVAFSPLMQIFAAILDVSVLHEQVYLGSVLGSFVVIVGMYVLLWGKSIDQEIACDKNMVDGCNGRDSLHDAASTP